MSTFQQLLASIGIGNAHLELSLNNNNYPRGTTIFGEVRLIGGKVEQDILSLQVTLYELLQQGKTTSKTDLAIEILSSQITIHPDEVKTYLIRLDIPETAKTTGSGVSTHVGAVADIALAINPSATVKVEIDEAREILAVIRAIEQLGFEKTSFYVDLRLDFNPNLIHRYYRAPDNLRDQFDGLALHIEMGPVYVSGSLIINRSAHNLKDRMKALVGADREEFPLWLDRKNLLNGSGAPNVKGTVPKIASILEDAKVIPASEKDWLLRAASAPSDGHDTLLRPAQDTHAPRTDDLLRPYNSKEKP